MHSLSNILKPASLSIWITQSSSNHVNARPSLVVSRPKIPFNEKRATKLRALATKLQESIDYDLNPASASQNVTLRRSRIISSMRDRADNNLTIQRYLLALATAWDHNDIPEEL